MAASRGLIHWEVTRDEEGQREYLARFHVQGAAGDGPQTISNATNLPAIGDAWNGAWDTHPFNDNDPWAFCTPYLKVSPIVTKPGEPVVYWIVEKKFSTLPITRCQDTNIANPISEPQKISGSFIDGKKKATKDKDGNLIKTTAYDFLEIDTPDSLPTVRIEQNVLSLGLDVFSPMMKTVNSVAMWGLDPRMVRMAGSSWSREFYGVCFKYDTRTFEFEIDFNTFDRDDIPNKSKSMIRGEWDSGGASYTVDGGASISNPFDYIAATDYKGNPKEYFLNKTTGAPSSSETYLDEVAIATESNFFNLGIPAQL